MDACNLTGDANWGSFHASVSLSGDMQKGKRREEKIFLERIPQNQGGSHNPRGENFGLS